MNDNNHNSSRTRSIALASYGGVLIIILCIGALLVYEIRALSVLIEPDERGVVLLLNQPTGEILEPGYHFLALGKQVVIIGIGRQTYVMSADSDVQPDFIEGKTKDGQKIQVDISVTYAINQEEVIELYTSWQNRYRDDLVRPASRGITRDALTLYAFDEILEKQEEIETLIFNELESSLAKNYIILVGFDLLDVRPVEK